MTAMEHGQQIDPVAFEAMRISLEKMGAQVGGLTQQSAFWELKYREQVEMHQSVMAILERGGVDLGALVASETNEEAAEELQEHPLVSEDGDDGSATS